MQYNRCLLLSIFVNIRQIKLSRQTEVKLTGRKRIFITDSRLYVNIQLRAVESSFTDLLCIFDTDAVHNITQGILCCIPHFIIIMIFLFVLRITQGQYTTVICNTKILVCAEDQVYYSCKLFLDLFRCYKQMGIILAEMSASFNTL